MLSDQDLMRVQAVSAGLRGTVLLLLNETGTDSPFEHNLVNIARQIDGVTLSQIKLEPGSGSVIVGKPSLTLSDGTGGNIHYFAAPEGPELSPFLDVVQWLGKSQPAPRFGMVEPLVRLNVPASLLILIAPACPHCPETVRAGLSLAVHNKAISLIVVDALHFSDFTERFKVKSTPTVIINDGLTLVGRIGVETLAEQLLKACSGDDLTSIIDSMIRAGRAEDAADLLCSQDRPDAILPIYLSKEFSVRMGALVTMEEALTRNPRVLDPLVEKLSDLLFSEEVGLRGDTAELLGKIGNREAVPHLLRASGDPDADVREAVEEALQALEQPSPEA